jgi:hypothetical protein
MKLKFLTNKNLFIYSCFLFFQVSILAQNTPKKVLGIIKDSLGVVVNANIFNSRTLEGTFSSDEGTFEILASLGDSIQISSVPHKTKTVLITKQDIDKQRLEIYIEVKTIVLDEIKLKQNNLTGSLTSDLKKAHTKIRDSILNDNMEYIKKADKGDLKPDFIDTNVKPPENNVDPIGPANVVASFANPFIIKERAKKARLAYIRAFPKKILSDLGEDFFFNKLKIPKQHYFHFLEYCNPLDIEKKYKDGKALEVIEILQNESIHYLKIIREDN